MSDLSWWFSPHPDWEPGEDWPQEVPVVRYETDGQVALIDPLLPVHDDFDPGGKPVLVLLTQPAHYRGTDDVVSRYGAEVWVPPRAEWRKRPEHATLVSGDVLSGVGGDLHVFVDEADREPLLASLKRIAELPIERVIIPHGDFVPTDGAARIRAAVADAAVDPERRRRRPGSAES